MSDTDEDPPRDLAGEYVLGCLDADEMAQAERRRAADPGFEEEVAAWERRLAPLAQLVAPVQPPASLRERLEASISALGGTASTAPLAAGGPAAPSGPVAATPDNVLALRRSVRRWRVATLASLALAAGVAAFALIRPPEGIVSVAALAPSGDRPGVFLAVARPDGTLSLHPVSAVSVPPDRSLQLWSLPAGATTPASLGVLPAGGTNVQASPAPGGQLLISLEPTGGSPTGLPTGPVVYAGKVTMD